MTTAVLLGLLLIKHALLAHVVDFGYSASRNPSARYVEAWLALHTLVELLVSLFILRLHPCGEALAFLLMELLAHVISAVIERHAPVHKLLNYHLRCELAVVGVYAVLASCWLMAW